MHTIDHIVLPSVADENYFSKSQTFTLIKNPYYLKRSFDVCFAVLVLSIGSPVYLLLCLITALSSPGPVLFKQERIGKHGRPFRIYKFRSMKHNAETLEPQLSHARDPRITHWGKFIRSSRLDEMPQFWNVLIGDMSVVGPRPERQYFIEKIVAKNYNYRRLQILKPGLTSLGQINFGYAENVDEMCLRMEHDLEYLKKVNLSTDLFIILKTIKVMIARTGK